MNKTGVKELVAKANEIVDVWAPDKALSEQSDDTAVLIDIRDIRELNREGKIEGAVHVPRGMLEFWFGEDSPYHKPALADETKTYALFCAGGLRSALGAKSLVDMGFENIAHIDGGFAALKDAGATVISDDKK